MQCEQLIERYLGLLHDGFQCASAPHGYVLTTPFFGPDNDAIEVYVSEPNITGHIEVSDRGETLRYLDSFGVEFLRSTQRVQHFQRVVTSNGATLAGDEIRVLATEDDLVEAVDTVVHAAREAACLSHLLRSATRPNFRDQVATFLGQIALPSEFIEGKELVGEIGTWKVDFYINGEMNLAIEAMTASSTGYAQTQINGAFVKLLDIHRTIPNLRAFALLDDQENRLDVWPSQEIKMLSEQATIMRWGERERLRRALVEAVPVSNRPDKIS